MLEDGLETSGTSLFVLKEIERVENELIEDEGPFNGFWIRHNSLGCLAETTRKLPSNPSQKHDQMRHHLQEVQGEL